MKKVIFCGLLATALQFIGNNACAENTDAELLAKMLSETYGAEVEAEISKDVCKIKYPQVAVESLMQQVMAADADDKSTEPKVEKEVSYISATEASCAKIEDFDGNAQYKITDIKADKFLAQLYNLFPFAFIKDFEIKDFSEETSVVPALNLISQDKLSAQNIAYTAKDDTTGLKKEMGNLNALSIDRKVTKEGEILTYNYSSLLDTLNFAFPFFSMRIKSGNHNAELKFKLPADAKFDYFNPAHNIEYLTFSQSHAEDKGIAIGVDMFDVHISLNSEIKNYNTWKPTETFDCVGIMNLSNISVKGSMIEAMLGSAKQLQSIELKFALNDVDADSFKKMSKLQEEKAETGKDNDRELAKVMDTIADKAEMLASLKLVFANAEISGKFNFHKKNGFLVGVGKIDVKNLYNIFPEQKQCLKNPNAASIPACGEGTPFSDLKKYIDVSKDDSTTVIKFTDKGIFRDNKKIGEPVKLNFQRMQIEKEMKDKEKAERIKKLMEERKKLGK